MELTQSLLFVVSVPQIPLQQEQHQTEPELEIQMQMVVHQKLGQEPVHRMELMQEQVHQKELMVPEPVPRTIQY